MERLSRLLGAGAGLTRGRLQWGLGPTGEPPCLLPSRLRGFFASYVTTSNTSLVAVCSSQHQAQDSVSGECSASGFLKVLVYCALSLWDQSLIKRSRQL